MSHTLIPFAVFFIGIIVIQIFNRRALLKLSVEQKAQLVDFASGVAIWRLVPLVLIILGYGAFTVFRSSFTDIKIGLIVYFILILMSSMISNLIVQRRYSAMGFPEPYIKTTMATSISSILLLIAFFAWIAHPLFKIHG